MLKKIIKFNQIVLIACGLVLFSSSVLANYCGAVIQESFDSADIIIVQATLINSPMTDDEFKKYLDKYQPKDNFDKEYSTYYKNNNYLFQVNRFFKGDFHSSQFELLRSSNMLINFKIGSEYILFLRKSSYKNVETLNSDECVYLDVTNNRVVWDQTINDEILFKEFMNQLFNYKNTGKISKKFGEIEGRYIKIINKID